MTQTKTILLATAFAALVSTAGDVRPAGALDAIVFEELKENALEYGRYSGRFVTCDIPPPAPIRTSFLKYARSRGASDQHLQILARIFDDGQARTTDLRTGYSAEECREKLETPATKALLVQITEWYALPPHLKK
jgi:hypothetical protein